MRTKRATRASHAERRFHNQCRFNGGYHDAALAVREGWATPERNYGFGDLLEIRCPEDVLAKHFDKYYAEGWTQGYRDAKAGIYTGNSQKAWESLGII
jgi:hypothetical protein